MADHPFPNSPVGRAALRLLLVAGLRRWVNAGGGACAQMSVAQWEAVLAPLKPIQAATVVLATLFEMHDKRLGEWLEHGGRASAYMRLKGAMQVLRRSKSAETFAEMLESHHEPRSHPYRRKRSPKFKSAADTQCDRFFGAVRDSQFFDRLFGDAPPRTSDE